MIALADCNSFYANCEKVFRPDLKTRGVVVLSNNDSCIVAASYEAKAILRKLGAKRGVPYYKVRNALERSGVAIFSSNYPLYQDFSHRVIDIYRQHCLDLEVYSIDEAFLFLPDTWSFEQICSSMEIVSSQVQQWTGLSICIGIGRSKTLAKLANHWLKSQQAKNSMATVLVLDKPKEVELLKQTAIRDVWGIGKQKTDFLLRHRVTTAWDFAQLPTWWIKKNLSMDSVYTQLELQGQPIIKGVLNHTNRKSIVSGVSFTQPIGDKETLVQTLACHCVTAIEKLNTHRQQANVLSVIINTNRFQMAYRVDSYFVNLNPPSNYLPDLVKAARYCLDLCFESGSSYTRSAIMLSGLETMRPFQGDLFTPKSTIRQEVMKQSLNTELKKLQVRYGRDCLVTAATGFKTKSDFIRRERLSPKYTTSWQELPQLV